MEEYSQEDLIEPKQSVKFSINAKGNWSGEVKVYAQTPELAFKKAKQMGLELEELIKNKNEN